MKLSEKLASLNRENTVAELSGMLTVAESDGKLNHAHVSISWKGKRLVSVDGYEGSVEINELASKYLSADPFQKDTKATPRDRLTCDSLWGRVRQLYTDSDVEILNTSIYGYLVVIKECRAYGLSSNHPMAVIHEWNADGKKASLFDFTKDEFKKLWPKGEPRSKTTPKGDGEASERWSASREMVQQAVAAGNN